MAKRKPTASRLPPNTMGVAPAKEDEPREPGDEAASKAAEPKKSKALSDAAKELFDVLTGPGVLDPEGKYGYAFDAFAKAAEGSGDYKGLSADVMNEDVSNSVEYGKRVKARAYWAKKLASL